MNFKYAKLKTWLVAVALSALAGGVTAALPEEASARWRAAEHSGIHTKIHKPVISGKRVTPNIRINSRRTHGPALEKKFHRKPPSRIIKHRRPPVRRVVVHRPRPRLRVPTIAASFSYNFGVAPRYHTSAPIYTSVGIGFSKVRYPRVQSISVNTDLLNVRSGPNLNRPVICTASFGDVLQVQGAAQGWLHVTLADGRPGWVMECYTRQM